MFPNAEQRLPLILRRHQMKKSPEGDHDQAELLIQREVSHIAFHKLNTTLGFITELRHLLPGVSDARFLIKTWFNRPLAEAPTLHVGGTAVRGRMGDTRGEHWHFYVTDLKPNRPYRLALTDAKGNRRLKPHQQSDLDSNLRIVKTKKDGIVIRGAKLMICGTAASEEIFLLPGSVYREPDRDFALACVVPRDIEGLTIVETRRPSDERELSDGFDIPTETGITQAYLIFEDVFVPNERIFLAGEYQHTADIIGRFTATYRACIGACVAGQGDVMVGAAALIARANGLSTNVFREKTTQMEINNETTFAVGIGAIALGRQHPSGVWLADSLTAHANKIHVATLPYETKRLCQEIGGGIVETGCFPSYQDFTSPEYGHLIQKYIKAGAGSAETRARIARLIEWLTLGAGVPGCMHGGGSPDGARMVVYASSPLEEYIGYARKVGLIDEDLPEPVK